MVQKDFLLDFDLYICERFGFRNSLHVIPTQNGCCVGVNIKPLKLYIRFWEYSKGVGGFPDWCIILVHYNFAKKQEEELQELVRFFMEYAPRYGYKYIGMEEIGIPTYSIHQWARKLYCGIDCRLIKCIEEIENMM